MNKTRFWAKPQNCTGYLPLNSANNLFKGNLNLGRRSTTSSTGGRMSPRWVPCRQSVGHPSPGSSRLEKGAAVSA